MGVLPHLCPLLHYYSSQGSQCVCVPPQQWQLVVVVPIGDGLIPWQCSLHCQASGANVGDLFVGVKARLQCGNSRCVNPACPTPTPFGPRAMPVWAMASVCGQVSVVTPSCPWAPPTRCGEMPWEL